MLSPDERQRYRRHLILPEIGEAGQERLKAAKILVVGTGGLGSPCAFYLTAAGIGTLGLADADTVELSNLQRQILHNTDRIGRPKVDSARETLKPLNPYCAIATHHVRLDDTNTAEIIRPYDVVVECVDNFAARYRLNDACVQQGKPLVEAGVMGFDGIIMTIVPGQGPCYRCVFPPPPTAGPVKEPGIVGAVAGIAGAWQAMEAIKLVLGVGKALTGRLLAIDTLDGHVTEIAVRRDPRCPVCGEAAGR